MRPEYEVLIHPKTFLQFRKLQLIRTNSLFSNLLTEMASLDAKFNHLQRDLGTPVAGQHPYL
jgi:hypothetical protein